MCAINRPSVHAQVQHLRHVALAQALDVALVEVVPCAAALRREKVGGWGGGQK